jgi:hypothetical protein
MEIMGYETNNVIPTDQDNSHFVHNVNDCYTHSTQVLQMRWNPVTLDIPAESKNIQSIMSNVHIIFGFLPYNNHNLK